MSTENVPLPPSVSAPSSRRDSRSFRSGAGETGEGSSDARLRLFVDRAPAAIAMFDMEMCYLAASRRYLKDYRLEGVVTPEALLGRSHYEVFPDIPEHWPDIHRRVLAGETISVEDEPFPRADGRTDRVRWEMAPWYREDESIGGATLFSEVNAARVEADRALAASEALLRMTQEAGQVGGFVRDMQTGEITLSGGDCLIFGLPPGTRTLAREDWFAMLHPEDRERVAETIETLAQSGAPGRKSEYRIVRPDGAIRHIVARTRFERDDTGRAMRSIGVHVDVTEQRRLEASLREREKLFRAAFEQAAVGIVVRRGDPTFTIGEANEAFRQITGQTRDEVVAMKVGDLTHPDDIEAQSSAWNLLVSGQVNSIEYEKRYLRKDGGIRFASVSASRIPATEGNAECFLTVVHDLTERKRAEEALRESEELASLALESAGMGAWLSNPATGEMRSDARAKMLHGLSPEVPLDHDAGLAAVHPEDRQLVIAALQRAITSSEPYNVKLRSVHPDGSIRWLHSRGRWLPHPRKGEEKMIGVVEDITEQHRTQEALRRLTEELEQRVRQEVAAREAAQAQLAHLQRMEALGQLAGGIAHDFNNVLQAVQGGAGLIERRPTDPTSVRRFARMVFEAAERGSSITRRLLAFARRGDLLFEAVNAVSLLTDMREILMHTLGAGIGVRVDAASDLPALLADKGQLETVLVNLASNARDAMAGKGLLTLGARLDIVEDGERQDGFGHLKPGSYLCLSVSDTGAGMSSEVLARVTEPFFTTKERGQGTGLGLAMARGFAEQSGGGLRIESAPGQGTTVKLWFPLASTDEASASEATSDHRSTNGKSARLIVVDDEPLIREIITEQLEAAGYSVLSLASGTEALSALDAGEDADLIVADLSMPGMDGVTLIREAHRRRPKLPAILLTGFASNAAEMAVGGVVSGQFTLLRKPITEQHLAERVAVLLEGANAERRTD